MVTLLIYNIAAASARPWASACNENQPRLRIPAQPGQLNTGSILVSCDLIIFAIFNLKVIYENEASNFYSLNNSLGLLLAGEPEFTNSSMECHTEKQFIGGSKITNIIVGFSRNKKSSF